MSRQTWPPRIHTHRGVDYIRVPRDCGRVWVTLGPAGSELARAEYRRVVAEAEAHGRRHQPRGADVTVTEVVAAYLDHCEGYHCESQQARIRGACRPAVELYGHTAAREFGPLAYTACIQRLIAAGLARTTINSMGWCLYGLWQWAASRELVPASVPQSLLVVPSLRKGKSEAREPEPVRPADPAGVQSALACMSRQVADLLRLVWVTGSRPGEIALLRPVDLDRAWLQVEGQAVWLYRLDAHKGAWRGLLRWIPLGPRAQAIVGPYLDRPADAYCFSPREAEADWAARYGRRLPRKSSRQAGEHYDRHALAHAVSRACRRAGVAAWTPNQLRHLRGTEIEVACGREDARCVLGHRSPTITARYAESVERAARVLARLG